MKILNTLTASAVAAIISTAVWAQESGQNMDPASMPMHGYMQNGPAMNPQQMDWIRQQRNQSMQQQWMGRPGNMPMMDGRSGEMMMDPLARKK